MPAFVYVLRCSDGTLYTGAAKDLAARLLMHESGKASHYTRARRPVVAIARVGTSAPEAIDLLARGGAEADVQSPRHRVRFVSLGEREVVPLGEAMVGVGRLDAEGLQNRLVEALSRLALGDADRHVVEHGGDYQSVSRERRRSTALVCSCDTRDSVTPRTSPISRRVRFS